MRRGRLTYNPLLAHLGQPDPQGSTSSPKARPILPRIADYYESPPNFAQWSNNHNDHGNVKANQRSQYNNAGSPFSTNSSLSPQDKSRSGSSKSSRNKTKGKKGVRKGKREKEYSGDSPGSRQSAMKNARRARQEGSSSKKSNLAASYSLELSEDTEDGLAEG